MKRFPRIKALLLFVLFVLMAGCWGTIPSTTHLLTLGDDQIYAEVSGEGFPLVLVSGGGGMDLRQWERTVPALSQRYQVIRYDPRGIGQSDNPSARYSDADDLVALLNYLGLTRVGLIGLSSAGGFVLEFALQHPERVTAAVAVAPFVPGFEFSDQMMARLNTFNQAAQKGREPFLDLMFEDPHFFPAPLDRSIRAVARKIMAENFDKGAGFDPSLPIPLSPPLIEQLSNIEPPVLLIAGNLDHPEVLRRNQFLLEQIRLGREIRIAQAGHNVPLENPDLFLETVCSFLEELDLE